MEKEKFLKAEWAGEGFIFTNVGAREALASGDTMRAIAIALIVLSERNYD